jgi:hypothetical protein
MDAFVEMIVQKIADVAPIENTLSDLVAGVLENTAAKLARFETTSDEPEVSPEEAAA